MTSFQKSDPPRSSCNSRVARQPHTFTERPHLENYELPFEAPFTAEIVNVAYSATEADIQRAFSSLHVTEVRPSCDKRGRFFVEFLDVQGLKQCLDKYWMFKIHGRPIRTYVASVTQSSSDPLNNHTLSSQSSADLKHPLPPSLPSSFQSPSRYIQFQQSLVILIHVHMLQLLCESYLGVNNNAPRRPLVILKQDVYSFFKTVGHVSHSFFESALLAVKVFCKTNTFHLFSTDLPQLCSFASLFNAEVHSVFLYVKGTFDVSKFLDSSRLITGLKLEVAHKSNFKFLNMSSSIFPRLKELQVRVEPSVSMVFVEFLKVNTTVTSVSLQSNSIGAEGTNTLAEALKVNTAITSLNLSFNSIGNDGTKALAEVLKVNANLKSIVLEYNFIGADGAKALAEALKVYTSVTSIDLCENSIGADGARALAEALKVNTSVTSIDLCENSIGADGAKALAEALRVNATITVLIMGYNSIGDEGAEALAEALIVNISVTSIDLRNNSIGDEGAIALADALRVNTTVTAITLWDNSIGDDGARALSEALKVDTSVRNINLGINTFGSKGARALKRVSKINSKVQIKGLH
ncbi:hypothetical protein GEMRC1_007266 [Eukaryota sp. GEM-RC1]